MRVFSLNSVDFSAVCLRGGRPWALPAVQCPECSRLNREWGISWPQIDLRGSPLDKELARATPVSLEDFIAVHDRLVESVGTSVEMPPGVGLGVFDGTLRTAQTPIVFQFPWEMFFRQDTIEDMRSQGIRCPESVPAQIRSPRGRLLEYAEFVFPVLPALHESSYAERVTRCPLCDQVVSEVQLPVIKSSVIRDGIELFKCIDWPWRIFVTERVAEYIELLDVPGLLIEACEAR